MGNAPGSHSARNALTQPSSGPLKKTIQREHTGAPAESAFVHNGIMCDGCGSSPIVGTRWSYEDSDYCDSCKVSAPAEIQQHLIPNTGPILPPKPVYVPTDANLAPRKLLVIDSPGVRWADVVFEGATLPCGSAVETLQCGWDELSFTSYFEPGGETRAMCSIGKGSSRVMYKPDFLLLRNEVYSLPPQGDHRNLLYGLQFAQVPSVNSLEAVHGLMERPWAFAALIKLQKKLGHDAFPLIPQYYYPNHREMNFAPEFPVAAKVAHGQAGFGKMKVPDSKAFADLASVMAMNTQYCTAEPFVEGEYDIRIQKIGPHYRCWKRISISGEWKTNTGTSHVSPIPLTDQYKMWADEASTLFGGMDILSVDAIHTTSGEEFILEVNGSSSGFMPDTQQEDNAHVREVVLNRMAEEYPVPTTLSHNPYEGDF